MAAAQNDDKRDELLQAMKKWTAKTNALGKRDAQADPEDTTKASILEGEVHWRTNTRNCRDLIIACLLGTEAQWPLRTPSVDRECRTIADSFNVRPFSRHARRSRVPDRGGTALQDGVREKGFSCLTSEANLTGPLWAALVARCLLGRRDRGGRQEGKARRPTPGDQVQPGRAAG